MEYTVTEVLFKYGQANQTTTHFFKTKKQCVDFCNENTKFPDKPSSVDWDYFEDFQYHLKKWENAKKATKDTEKWYLHFLVNDVFFKGITTDL